MVYRALVFCGIPLFLASSTSSDFTVPKRLVILLVPLVMELLGWLSDSAGSEAVKWLAECFSGGL